jgi:cytosine/adenosine deaminase-related metal-dependent hydrolase
VILRARTVVTMDGAPIENGAIAIAGERISDVGTFAEVARRNRGEVTDLGEQILLPGLINAHCHLDYTCLRGKIPRPTSFTEWIRAINAEKAKLSPENYVASIGAGFAEATKFGTTTIANLMAFPELIAQIEAPIRTWWFAELLDVREPQRTDAIVNRAVEYLKVTRHWGLAPHALFTASPKLFRGCEDRAAILTTHLAESRDEMAMYRDRSGPLYEFLSQLGREMDDCDGRTPVAVFGEMTTPRLTKNWMLVHLNDVSEDDLDLLVSIMKHCSIVHCPRSHKYFRHPKFQFEKFRERKFNICLGTDSLASNDDLSLFGEMRAFQETHAVSPAEVLEMVTINSAKALGAGDKLGQLKAGFLADLIAIPVSSSQADPFEQVVASQKLDSWMMISGKVCVPSTI